MHAGLCLERAALHLSQTGPGLEREDFSESFMVLEWSASSVSFPLFLCLDKENQAVRSVHPARNGS